MCMKDGKLAGVRAVLMFCPRFCWMQGSLNFDERLRRACESLCVEKAAHAVTRAKLEHCQAELMKLQGSGGRPMIVAADTEGGPSNLFDGDIHTSSVTGDDNGADCGVPHHVPPHVVADEPALSAERTHFAAADPEDRQCTDPNA